MATENLVMAEELVRPDYVNDTFDGIASSTDELGGFSNIDDLEEFLAKFNEGTEEEATFQTQGECDVGGEPISTIH